VFDRIRIWDEEVKTLGDDSPPVQRFVHYEIKDEHGIPFIHGAIPVAEWNALRAKQIITFPPNVSISLLTDLIAVLSTVVDDI
jgi:hypothetical protein